MSAKERITTSGILDWLGEKEAFPGDFYDGFKNFGDPLALS
jgi:hypothetical protein